jgi:hypothetical protein
MRIRARTAKIWSAVTCHRCLRLADLSARQSRVQRLAANSRARPFDGDKSPAESGENSPHSISSQWRRQPRYANWRSNHKFLRRTATAWTRNDRRRRRSGRCVFWQTKVRQQPTLFIERHPNLARHRGGWVLAGDSSFRSFRAQIQREDDAPNGRDACPGFRARPQPGTPPRRGPRF